MKEINIKKMDIKEALSNLESYRIGNTKGYNMNDTIDVVLQWHKDNEGKVRRDCDTCKHEDLDAAHPTCLACTFANVDNWQPKEQTLSGELKLHKDIDGKPFEVRCKTCAFDMLGTEICDSCNIYFSNWKPKDV
jgi:hypothetical protein